MNDVNTLIISNMHTARTHGWRADKGPNPANDSGFSATGCRILLLPDQVEETTASGIVLPKTSQNKMEMETDTAVVVEIGHDAWFDKSTDYCNIGDRVLIGKYTGILRKSPTNGKTYRFVQDTDIISPVSSPKETP